MCGRSAQSVGAVMAASSSLGSNSHNSRGGVVDNIGPRSGTTGGSSSRSSGNGSSSGPTDNTAAPIGGDTDTNTKAEFDNSIYPWRDNFNLSPGHDAVVFSLGQQGQLQMDRKIWGLVSKGGTIKSPLPGGPSKHFSNLMFNARSDTLFSKPTFSKLLGERKSCLVAFDGFFEWKSDPLGGGKGKKQPYFVFRRNDNDEIQTNDNNQQKRTRPYLLMAGLWTSVPTGYPEPQPQSLDTFTILTTEVCDPLKWLHSRMPVCVWDESLAWEWLTNPTQKIHQEIDKQSYETKENIFQWHAVTTQMSSTKYRNADSIKAFPKPRSVKSFFAPVGKKGSKTVPIGKKNQEAKSDRLVSDKPATKATPAKRPAPNTGSSNNPMNKKLKPDRTKKGSIASYFSPKQDKS